MNNPPTRVDVFDEKVRVSKSASIGGQTVSVRSVKGWIARHVHCMRQSKVSDKCVVTVVVAPLFHTKRTFIDHANAVADDLFEKVVTTSRKEKLEEDELRHIVEACHKEVGLSDTYDVWSTMSAVVIVTFEDNSHLVAALGDWSVWAQSIEESSQPSCVSRADDVERGAIMPDRTVPLIEGQFRVSSAIGCRCMHDAVAKNPEAASKFPFVACNPRVQHIRDAELLIVPSGIPDDACCDMFSKSKIYGFNLHEVKHAEWWDNVTIIRSSYR